MLPGVIDELLMTDVARSARCRDLTRPEVGRDRIERRLPLSVGDVVPVVVPARERGSSDDSRIIRGWPGSEPDVRGVLRPKDRCRIVEQIRAGLDFDAAHDVEDDEGASALTGANADRDVVAADARPECRGNERDRRAR